MQYSLPCSCGNTIPVEVGQAGQIINCQCGRTIEVPTMRAIWQLEPVGESPPARRSTSEWSKLQRTFFTLGLALAAAGFSVAAYYQWGRSQLSTEEVAWDRQLGTHLELLETMDLEEAWENWKEVRESSIGPYMPPQYVRARALSRWWQKFVWGALAVGATGLLLMGVSFVLPQPSRKPSPRRRSGR